MVQFVYLVAVDGSEWSDRAAGRAVTLAESTGAEVCFATVIPWSNDLPFTHEAIPLSPEEEKSEEAFARVNVLDPLEKRFGDSDVKTTYETYWGHPAKVLHELAKTKHANMIFVGRRGRSKVSDLLLGSVANSLAHITGVPVVLVP